MSKKTEEQTEQTAGMIIFTRGSDTLAKENIQEKILKFRNGHETYLELEDGGLRCPWYSVGNFKCMVDARQPCRFLEVAHMVATPHTE